MGVGTLRRHRDYAGLKAKADATAAQVVADVVVEPVVVPPVVADVVVIPVVPDAVVAAPVTKSKHKFVAKLEQAVEEVAVTALEVAKQN